MIESECAWDFVERLRAGDDAAAAALFHRFSGRLVELARTHLRGTVAAKVDPEDVLQSVFRSFFARQRAGQFEIEQWSELWALLTVITIRKCHNRVAFFLADRRDVTREAAPSDAAWTIPDRAPTPCEAATLADLVMVLARQLNDRDRQVMELRLQGYTAEEIATRIGRAIRTVRRSLERVRDRAERLFHLTTTT